MDAHNAGRRLLAGLTVLVLLAGCAASASQPGTPTLGPTASATAALAATPTPLPTQFVPTAAPTGPMGAGRQIHTATLLADGRVLVAGGYDANDAALASAELYNPSTNAFTSTGSLVTARGLHTATVLVDGRVLIAGGGPASWLSVPPGPYLASAELYDPKTGTFSPTGSMTVAREDHTATRLADGRVLIVGGNDAGDHAVASAELYDPKAGTFSPTGSMTTARGFPTATLLADGRVLIVGGNSGTWNFIGSSLASAEIYDPKTGKFSPTGKMTIGRVWDAATRLSDGRVLITGGCSDNAGSFLFLSSAEIFDPKTGKFSPTGPMADKRLYHTATLLADGRVLVAGGGGDYVVGGFLASAELYDPKTGKFTATGSMTDQRTYQQATLLTDGRVLVTAGEGDKQVVAPLGSAEIFDPKTGTFSPAGQGG